MHSRYILSFFFACMAFGILNAQPQTHPVSWSLDDEIDVNLSYVVLNEVNVAELMQVDEVVNQDKSVPYRFAYKHQVNLGLQNSGRWVTMSNGDRIWMLAIESSNAHSLAVTFSELSLPKGSLLYLYKPDRSEVIGPISSENNKDSGVFTTNPVGGDRLILEYYEPYNARNDGELKIRSVAHAYRVVETESCDSELETSCNVNVICDDYLQWISQRSAVVRLTVDDGTRWCNGVMLNNAAQDGRPLLLVALADVVGDPESFVANFNFQSNTCSPSTRGKLKNSISGTTQLAVAPGAGLALLELSRKPLDSWNVFHAGWDKSGGTPFEVTSIHYPKGDVKKICSEQGMPNMEVFHNQLVWEVQDWDIGTIQAGSVGAPLFDEFGRVIGSFLGGFGDCSTSNFSYFGKLSLAWDEFDKFLNPHNLNISKLNGLFPDFYVIDEDILKQNVAVFPNPANEHITIINENSEGLEFLTLYDASGRPVMGLNYTGGPVSVSHLERGTYFVVVQLESFQVKRKLIIY